MAHHFEPAFTGGFLGVDLFFVLSGYLITSLLVNEHELTSGISLGRFYARRALRLLPALIPLFAIVAVAWTLRPYPSAFGPIASAIIVLAYIGNWVVAATHDGLGYLSHTWSLAIEEQFYVLWPLTLIWLLRRSSLGAIARGLFIAVLFVGAVRAAGWIVLGTTALLYVTPSRADGLLVGCALALALRAAPSLLLWRVATAPFAGVAAIVALAVLFTVNAEAGPVAYLGGVTAAVLCGAALIAHLEMAPTLLPGRLFSLQPLPAIGRISYGLYLFHYPVALYLYAPDRTPTSFAIKLVVTFAIAITSYLLIERPALRLKRRFRLVPARGAPSGVATA